MEMENSIKTFAVKNKNICNRLVNAGHELLNVTKNRDNPAEPCFIFERTDEFIKAFDEIQNEIKGNRGLDTFETDYVCKLLESKRDEYGAIGIKTDTIDKIIGKLKRVG